MHKPIMLAATDVAPALTLKARNDLSRFRFMARHYQRPIMRRYMHTKVARKQGQPPQVTGLSMIFMVTI
jgi:hypothetical protein